MKKTFIIITLAAAAAYTANAQTFKDTFDSNSMGWTEMSSSDGEVVIKDGVMHLQGKKNGSNFYVNVPGTEIKTSCYTGFDPQENFEIKCKANIKKINSKNPIGIMLNYQDDYNYIGRLVGYRENLLKLQGKRNAEVQFSIKSTYNKIQFLVNNMVAIELRYKPIISNGIGFYLYGAQTADFDDLEIIQ